jgi:multicomponent Na+:H+ antiporter subunit D
MAIACLLGGVFYDRVLNWLLNPAASAALNVTNYIDRMMGQGYAAQAGVENMEAHGALLSFWNPLMWLVLFVVVLFAVGFVIITGKKMRGPMLEESGSEAAVPSKYDSFFGGEKALPSHVGGSDLFWGFKYNWKGYFHFMERMHSGVVNDYAMWAVAGGALVILYTFIFLR